MNGSISLPFPTRLRSPFAPDEAAFDKRARALLRRWIPFSARLALLRAPAIARWVLNAKKKRPPLPEAGFAHLQCERFSPLRRAGTLYAPSLQRAKEHNVRLAASLVDSVEVLPGETFSWHERVGPPLGLRGFQPGPEIHGDALASGPGGGLCQVANMVYWLALHAGMTIVERHGHALDLFPDHERDVPFGCGATVFYPTRDLRFINPLDQPVRLELAVLEDRLRGRALLPRDPEIRWEVKESAARFVRAPDGPWRENTLYRVRRTPDGGAREELLCRNRAKVAYAI